MSGFVDLQTTHTVWFRVCFVVIEVVTHFPMPVQQPLQCAKDQAWAAAA
jgi:hypothetical protein